jgi:hypothetical protein
MRPDTRKGVHPRGWKRWVDRVAVVWIVCAPVIVLAAGWLGLLPRSSRSGPVPRSVAATEVLPEVPIQYRLSQAAEPSARPAEGRGDEPWRTTAVRPRR